MIDWSKVEELHEEIGAEDFDEVVQLFLDEVDEAIQQLHAGNDQPTLEASLHFLKGSALNLGFSEFSNLCSRGEKLAGQGQVSEADLQHVHDIFVTSRKAFLSEWQVRLSA